MCIDKKERHKEYNKVASVAKGCVSLTSQRIVNNVVVSKSQQLCSVCSMIAWMKRKIQKMILVMVMCRWDHRSSVVTPEEDVFYLVAFLRSALDAETLEYLTNQNRQILRFCHGSEIKVKQYLPHYTTQQEWMDHFGDKWTQFNARKMQFDPRRILATGQQIFQFHPEQDDM